MSRRIGLRTISSLEAVELPVEGDYSSYTAKWKQAYAAGESDYNFMVRCDESLDLIFIESVPNAYLTSRKLSDGTTATVTIILSFTYNYAEGYQARSVLSKYFAFPVDDGGVPKLKIYKNGALLQTIDLSQAPISWSDTTTSYIISMSPDGKYIFINNVAANEYALFQGS